MLENGVLPFCFSDGEGGSVVIFEDDEEEVQDDSLPSSSCNEVYPAELLTTVIVWKCTC